MSPDNPLGSALLSGCQYDPYAHLYATERPEKSDLVGVWVGEFNGSAKWDGLDKQIPGTFRLELAADGSFVGTRVSVTMSGSERRSGSGSWTIEKDLQGWWILGLDYEGAPGEMDVYDGMAILGNEAPYVLFDSLSDPDLGRGVIYRREDAKHAG